MMFKPVKPEPTLREIEDLIVQYARVCHQNDFGNPLPEYKAYEIRRTSVSRHLQVNHPGIPDAEITNALDRLYHSKQILFLKEESIIFPVGILSK